MSSTNSIGVTHIVVMGVCGSGKSTLAQSLAAATGATLIEADDFHEPVSIEKMAQAIPLTDEDRWPWLTQLSQHLSKQAELGHNTVMACSALKRVYRDRLRQANGRLVFVHLCGAPDLLRNRLASRPNHFATIDLLQSQLLTLEDLGSDEDGFNIDCALSPVEQNREALAGISDFV